MCVCSHQSLSHRSQFHHSHPPPSASQPLGPENSPVAPDYCLLLHSQHSFPEQSPLSTLPQLQPESGLHVESVPFALRNRVLSRQHFCLENLLFLFGVSLLVSLTCLWEENFLLVLADLRPLLLCCVHKHCPRCELNILPSMFCCHSNLWKH